MKRIATVVFAACMAIAQMAAGGAVGAPALAGPDDKKPVRKPVINLDSTAKQRRPGQVLPGDTSPTPAPKATPAPVPAPPPTKAPEPPPPVPVAQPAPQPPAPSVQTPVQQPEPCKETPPAPKLRASASSVSGATAGAQVRRIGGGGGASGGDGAWVELTSEWAGETPIELRVGVHAPVVVRIAGEMEGDVLVPDTLVTLWPLARVVIAPEFAEGRWSVGVRVARGQVTLQPDVIPNADPTAARRWGAVVRTPERAIPVAGAGGRVAYDPVRHTRVWTLMND